MAEKRDPFRPPDVGTQAPLDLASPPKPRTAPAVPEPELPVSVFQVPPPRAPVKYKAPKASWVLVLLLALAGIGFATITFGVFGMKWADLGKLPARLMGKQEEGTVYQSVDKTNDQVLIEIAVTPRSAKILLDGEDLASNPILLQRSDETRKLLIVADGYETTGEEFQADKPKTIQIKMKRSRP